jgi:hypothetical protein
VALEYIEEYYLTSFSVNEINSGEAVFVAVSPRYCIEKILTLITKDSTMAFTDIDLSKYTRANPYQDPHR